MKENSKVTSDNFDVAGMGVGRLLRQYIRDKLTPLLSFSSELKLSHILGLFIRHRFGYGIAYLTTRYESQWNKLLHNWRRFSGRFRKQKKSSHPKQPG